MIKPLKKSKSKPKSKAEKIAKTPSIARHNIWTTADEIHFIKEMGTHAEGGMTTPIKKLLANYIRAAKSRKDWGFVNPQAVLSFAENRLRSLTATA